MHLHQDSNPGPWDTVPMPYSNYKTSTLSKFTEA